MPRRKRGRWMHRPPQMRGFKPFGTPFMNTEPVVLLLEEYESIKLADYDNLNQKDAALKMGVSRPTFTRIYDIARKKVAKAFVEGLPIIIHGGNVEFRDNWYRCLDCNRIFRIDKNINNIDKVYENRININEVDLNKNNENSYNDINDNINFHINTNINAKNNNIKNKNNIYNKNIIKCPFCGSTNVISVEELHRKHIIQPPWF